jgi:cob(I)alamin adenosyltransferase
LAAALMACLVSGGARDMWRILAVACVALVALAAAEKVNAAPRQYLNRLSDLLFVLARVLNRANLDGLGGDDVYWQSERMARSAD